MPEGNGNTDYRQMIHDLVEAARLNLEEHDRFREEHQQIWNAIAKLHESQAGINESVANLVGAIRDLIDRIPPGNLR